MGRSGVATQADLDAVKKRVRAGAPRRHERPTSFGGQEVGREEAHGEEGRSRGSATTRGHDILGIARGAPSPARRRARPPRDWRTARAGGAAAVARGAGDRRREPGDRPRRWSTADPPVRYGRRPVRLTRGREVASALDRFAVDLAWPRLPRRGRVHGWVHGLPPAGRGGERGGRGRGVRPAGVGVRNDPRVTVMERTNVRDLGRALPFAPDGGRRGPVVHLAPVGAARARRTSRPGDAEFVLLVKPQFEAGRRTSAAGESCATPPLAWVLREVAAPGGRRRRARRRCRPAPGAGGERRVPAYGRGAAAGAETSRRGAPKARVCR